MVYLGESNYFIGLVFGCPYQKEQIDCPYCSIRAMEPEDRIDFYIKMEVEKKKDLIKKHKKCSNCQGLN